MFFGANKMCQKGTKMFVCWNVRNTSGRAQSWCFPDRSTGRGIPIAHYHLLAWLFLAPLEPRPSLNHWIEPSVTVFLRIYVAVWLQHQLLHLSFVMHFVISENVTCCRPLSSAVTFLRSVVTYMTTLTGPLMKKFVRNCTAVKWSWLSGCLDKFVYIFNKSFR